MALLYWLGADPSRYLVVSQCANALLVAIVLAGILNARCAAKLATQRGTVAFLILVFVVLMAGRWPSMFVTHVFSHDEGEFLSEALTALHHPIPWLDFDAQTAGPLNVFLLMTATLAGGHLTFFTARLYAIVLEFGSIAALYAAVATCFDAAIARLAVVPPLLFWTLGLNEDYIHFGSEHFPIFLSALLVALLCRAWRRSFPPSSTYGIGFLAGAMPFGKLQTVPFTAALVAVVIVTLFATPGLRWRDRRKRIGVLASGIATVPLIIIEAVAFAGGYHDFWIRYIQTSLAYVMTTDVPLSFFTGHDEFGPYFNWLTAFTALGGIFFAARFKRLSVRTRYLYVASVVMVLGAIDTILTPHRQAPNYLLFAVIPLASSAAASLGVISESLADYRASLMRRGLAVWFVALAVVFQHAISRPSYGWVTTVLDQYQRGGDMDPMVVAIGGLLKPGERLAIWGYSPEYCVYTGTQLGTRDPTSFWQFTPYFNPYRDYYRESFVADLVANKPEGFLDSAPTVFDYDGSMHDGYESFPELATVIDRDYVLESTWQRTRFFLRRDLAPPAPPKA